MTPALAARLALAAAQAPPPAFRALWPDASGHDDHGREGGGPALPRNEWPEGLEKVGGQKGSNKGGSFRDAQGRKWYVKDYRDPRQGAGEKIANDLYRRVGVAAPESALGEGGLYASRWIEGTEGTIGDRGLTKAAADEILDGFAADVLTANWDAVGTGLDNVVAAGGRVVRVDQGGALLHRAQGAPKPEKLLDKIGEWDSFRDRNPYYRAVLARAGYDRADDMGERVARQIDRIAAARPAGGWKSFVDASAPSSPGKYRERVARMLDKRTDLLVAKAASLRARATLRGAEWDESKHPRDDKGKFSETEGGGGTAPKEKAKPATKDQIATAVSMKKAGMTYADIQKATGLNPKQAATIVHKANKAEAKIKEALAAINAAPPLTDEEMAGVDKVFGGKAGLEKDFEKAQDLGGYHVEQNPDTGDWGVVDPEGELIDAQPTKEAAMASAVKEYQSASPLESGSTLYTSPGGATVSYDPVSKSFDVKDKDGKLVTSMVTKGQAESAADEFYGGKGAVDGFGMPMGAATPGSIVEDAAKGTYDVKYPDGSTKSFGTVKEAADASQSIAAGVDPPLAPQWDEKSGQWTVGHGLAEEKFGSFAEAAKYAGAEPAVAGFTSEKTPSGHWAVKDASGQTVGFAASQGQADALATKYAQEGAPAPGNGFVVQQGQYGGYNVIGPDGKITGYGWNKESADAKAAQFNAVVKGSAKPPEPGKPTYVPSAHQWVIAGPDGEVLATGDKHQIKASYVKLSNEVTLWQQVHQSIGAPEAEKKPATAPKTEEKPYEPFKAHYSETNNAGTFDVKDSSGKVVANYKTSAEAQAHVKEKNAAATLPPGASYKGQDIVLSAGKGSLGAEEKTTYQWKEKTSGPQAGKYAYFKDGVQVSSAFEKADNAAAAATIHQGKGPTIAGQQLDHFSQGFKGIETIPGAEPLASKGWPISEDTTRALGTNYPKAVEAVGVKWANGLTASEKAAIGAYTGSAYASINEKLRDGHFTQSALNIKSALDKAPQPPPPELVWRGSGKQTGFVKTLKTGDVISMKGFQSTSINPEFAKSWGGGTTIFEIKPSKGGYVRPLSSHKSEYEFLLPHDAKYTIRGMREVPVKGGAGKLKVIQLEMH